ncbi:LppU/SCO3897 family protein [Umezawaea sp.]|uniref:LppU/SCO3897 family protein n=1 Tax=Umezawaea sp. TaxID=1955258 RepID=UPI002ED2BD4B
MRKIVTGLGVAALVLLGAYALGLFDTEEPPVSPVAVGQCASVSRAANEPRFTALDCGSDQANVKVAKVVAQTGEGCPTGGATYSTFTSTVTLCLVPNLVEGSCYGQDRASGLLKVPCGTAQSVKVAKVLGGGANCGEQRAVVYPEPAVTFCLAEGGA